MRKALLVVILVAASFAGGAAVNGPGLKWVKALISSRLRQGPPIPTVEVDSDPPAVSESPAAPPVPVVDDVPSAPAPGLGLDLLAAHRAATPEAAPIAQPPSPAEAPSPSPAAAPVLVAEPPAEIQEPAPSTPAEAPKKEPEGVKAASSGWSDAPGSAPSAAVLPRPRNGPGPTADASVAATSGAAPLPTPPSSAPASASAPAPDSGVGWPMIRKRMRAMGVKKYWVEGTPSGTVTFRCVVPVPGQEAVSQQFEADGEDDLEAAEVALRRASLWQAAQRLKD